MIKIRPFRESDYPSLAEILSANLPDIQFSPSQLKETDSALVKRKKLKSYVATKDNNTLGIAKYITMDIKAKNSFWVEIYVDPIHQNIGIGSMLLNKIKNDLKEKIPYNLHTQIRSNKKQSLGFLHKQNFEEVESLLFFEQKVEDFAVNCLKKEISKIKSNDVTIKALSEYKEKKEIIKKVYTLHNLVKKDIPDISSKNEQTLEEFFEKELNGQKGPNESIFIATHKDEPIGFHSTVIRGSNLFIKMTGVKPNFRKKKVASSLKYRSLLYAKKNDLKSIHTIVNKKNVEMIALNTKLGFRLINEKMKFCCNINKK